MCFKEDFATRKLMTLLDMTNQEDMNKHIDGMQKNLQKTFEDKGSKEGDNVINQHNNTQGTRFNDPGNQNQMPRRNPANT